MDVKQDGCDIGRYNSTPNSTKVTCKATTSSKYANYNSTYNSDDPTTVNHLFVGDTPDKLVQLPLGSKPPLDELLNCDNNWHYDGWEDGGGWAQQDFFYSVRAACKSVDGENVRLTN
jgi:hypothetical protein